MNWQDYAALAIVAVWVFYLWRSRHKKPPHCANCAAEDGKSTGKSKA